MIKLNRQLACRTKNIPSSVQTKIWIATVLSKASKSKSTTSAEITLRIVNSTESAKLNEAYRHKKGPTNVLSFPDTPIPGIKSNYLGDLVICAKLVEEEALHLKIKPKDHWAHLIIHGTLHLLGYDHLNDKDAKKMEGLEVIILKGFKIKNPYR